MKRNRTIGILAHVDAGKTTLSEQILYRTGAVRTPGRVDHGNTVMDSEPVERERGITVFSDQAVFEHGGNRYTLIDTPGHVDFAAEAERALDALDAAVLLADASDGIKPHAALLERMARRRRLPVILFLNKCDLPSADPERVTGQARLRFGATPVTMPAQAEEVAELDEAFLELYLEGKAGEEDCEAALGRAFRAGEAMPVLTGSALNGEGVDALLDTLDRLLCAETPDRSGEPLDARVYKVRRDAKGRRVTFVRLEAGRIQPRDSFVFGDQTEKVQEIRVIRGNRYETVGEAVAGDAVGLTGLTGARCGDRLEQTGGERVCTGRADFEIRPALAARVTAADGTPDAVLMEKLRLLEDEEPQLGVTCETSTKEILVSVMGPVQLEILERLMPERFGVKISLSPPRVLYRETIAGPVMGYGHYEPLRHYAETNLRLEPAPRGSGISFASECHVDRLPAHYQNLIRTHIFERVHRGVLTGAPLTDVRVVLTAGRAHDKHTEGGDFREATYRAVRQGLMNAENVLLEPYYRFEIVVPADLAGRVMAELPTLDAEFEPPEIAGGEACIRGRGPVATMMDYGVKLRSMTHGEGSAVFSMDGYAPCHNASEVIAAADYNPDADSEQPASSVFCAHGAGFVVPWNEAEAHMHCPGR